MAPDPDVIQNAVELSPADTKFYDADLNRQAKLADEVERQETIWQAVGKHRLALFWALMVSMCVIMEGYDTILLGNFYAYPQFAKKFGTYTVGDPDNPYQVSAAWQAGLSNASGVGAFFGAMLNGVLVDRFGQKRVVLASLLTLTAFIFIVFFAPNAGVLLAGEFLCGLPWGIFATTSPAYASEVLPIGLRVYLTSWTNMCFIIGQLIGAGVLEGLVNVPNEWGYRVPFAIQWFWPCLLFPILCFAPESPWYLVRKDRIEEAKESLRRLNPSDPESIGPSLALIIHTNNQEKELLNVKTSYLQCFQGVELRRTEIACVAFAGQITCGLVMNSTFFFQQVGLNTTQTYRLNVGSNALALVSTLVSWFFVMPHFGRRTIYICGCAVMAIILYIVGILQAASHHHQHTVGMAQAVLMLLWVVSFQITVGQLGWSLPAEVGSTRLRQKTVVIARNSYYVTSVIGAVLEPYFISPTAWNLKGYTALVWAGTSTVTLVWAIFRLPETKGRSYEELNLMFAQRLPARHFKNYEVDVFGSEEEKVEVAHVEEAVSPVK